MLLLLSVHEGFGVFNRHLEFQYKKIYTNKYKNSIQMFEKKKILFSQSIII